MFLDTVSAQAELKFKTFRLNSKAGKLNSGPGYAVIRDRRLIKEKVGLFYDFTSGPDFPVPSTFEVTELMNCYIELRGVRTTRFVSFSTRIIAKIRVFLSPSPSFESVRMYLSNRVFFFVLSTTRKYYADFLTH